MLKKPVPQDLPRRGLTKRANATLRQIFGVFTYKCLFMSWNEKPILVSWEVLGRFVAKTRHKKWRKCAVLVDIATNDGE